MVTQPADRRPLTGVFPAGAANTRRFSSPLRIPPPRAALRPPVPPSRSPQPSPRAVDEAGRFHGGPSTSAIRPDLGPVHTPSAAPPAARPPLPSHSEGRGRKDASTVHSFQAEIRCMSVVDDRFVWTGEKGGTIKIRDSLSGKEQAVTRGREPPSDVVVQRTGLIVNCLLKVGNTMWAGFNDGNIKVFSLQTKELLRELSKHSGGVTCMVNGFGGFVYSGGPDWKIVQWNPSSYKQSAMVSGHSSPIRVLCSGATTGTRSLLFSGSDDTTIKCWTPRNISTPDRSEVTLRGHTGPVTALVCTDNLWSASEDRSLRCWEIESASCIKVLDWGCPVTHLALCGVNLWCSLRDGVVKIVDPTTFALVQSEKTESRLMSMSEVGKWSGDRVWTVGADGTVRCWRTPEEADSVRELQGRCAEKEEQVVQLHQQVDDLQNIVRSLQDQLDRRESDHFKQVERNLELQGEYEEAASRGRSTDSDLATLRKELSLEREHAISLEKERTRLEGKVDAANSHIQLLESEVAELKAVRSEVMLQQGVQSLMDRVSQLQHGHGTGSSHQLDTQLAALARENEVLREALRKKDAELAELEIRARMASEGSMAKQDAEQRIKEKEDTILYLEGQVRDLQRAKLDAERAAEAEAAAKEELARLYDAAEVAEKAKDSQLSQRIGKMGASLKQAEDERDLLEAEVRRLGELLTEVSAKAKEYQSENAILLDKMKRELSVEKTEIEARLREAKGEAAEAAASNRLLQRQIAVLQQELEQLRGREEVPQVADLKARWDDERKALEERIHQLEEDLQDHHPRKADWETPNQAKLREALNETQQTLTGLEQKFGDTHKELEAAVADKDRQLQEALKELQVLKDTKGDSSAMSLYTQLQHEQVVKSELQRQIDTLSETVQQLNTKIIALSSANRKLQAENDRLRDVEAPSTVAGGAPPVVRVGSAATDQPPPTSPPPPVLGGLKTQASQQAPSSTPGLPDISHPEVVPPALRSTTREQPARPLPIDKLNRELDGLVGFIDGMKNKLEHLERAAESAKDPYIREALLQEINAIHRQVLDDTLVHKHGFAWRSPERKRMELPSPIAGGILKVASEKFAAVEEELGITPSVASGEKSPPLDHIDREARELELQKADKSLEAANKSVTLMTEDTLYPSYNTAAAASLIRRAYGLGQDVTAQDVLPALPEVG